MCYTFMKIAISLFVLIQVNVLATIPVNKHVGHHANDAHSTEYLNHRIAELQKTIHNLRNQQQQIRKQSKIMVPAPLPLVIRKPFPRSYPLIPNLVNLRDHSSPHLSSPFFNYYKPPSSYNPTASDIPYPFFTA